ncbi:hypothetical protein AUP68_07727 [Ilyonectria robusta]
MTARGAPQGLTLRWEHLITTPLQEGLSTLLRGTSYMNSRQGGDAQSLCSKLRRPSPRSDRTRAREWSHLTKYTNGKTLDGKFTDFILNNCQTNKQDINIVLNSLAGVSFKGETNEAISLDGKFTRYRRLQELWTFFNKVKDDDDVKACMPKWIKLSDMIMGGSAVCLVVGVMSCEDVDMKWGATTRKDAVGQIEASIDRIGLALAVTNPFGGTGNLQATGSIKKAVGKIFKAHSNESKIFAIQLRSVTKGFILKHNQLILQIGAPSVDRGYVAGHDGDADDSAIPDELFLVEPEPD